MLFISIVNSCSLERLQVWNTITYFTERTSFFHKSKALIYHMWEFLVPWKNGFFILSDNNFSLRQKVQPGLLIFHEMRWCSLCMRSEGKCIFFIMTWKKQDKEKAAGDTDVRAGCDKWVTLSLLLTSRWRTQFSFEQTPFIFTWSVPLKHMYPQGLTSALNTFPALSGKRLWSFFFCLHACLHCLFPVHCFFWVHYCIQI